MFTKKSDTIYRGELPKKGVLDSADLSGVCQKSVIVFFREGGGDTPMHTMFIDVTFKVIVYSQTCIRRPLLGSLRSGHLGQVVFL